MLIKQRKISANSIVWISLLVIIITLLLSNKGVRQQSNISAGDYMQKFMSLNLGFSSLINLIDTGHGDIDNKTSTELRALVTSIPKIAKHNLFNHNSNKFERLDITIDFSDYLKINEDRKKAINNGILSNATKVKAKLRHNGIEYKAKLRLKGDNPSHWYNTPRLSFRVKVKKGKTLLGFSVFSIQKPRERQFPYDYIFQSLIRDIGNISPIHKFVHLYVNGDDWGIMNMEEHVSKELLEKQNKKDSVIVRFADEKTWRYRRISKKPYRYYRLSDSLLYARLYNNKNIQNRKIYSYILNSRIDKNASYIYDVNSFSKAYILTAIWGNSHVLHDSNTKYYFNPYTLKLEPITTDQHPSNLINEQWMENFLAPIQYIDVIKTKAYTNNLDRNLQKVKNAISNIEKYLSYTKSLFPVDRKKSAEIVKDNMKKIILNKEYYLMTSAKEWKHHMNNKASQEFTLPTKQQASEFNEHLHIRHYTDGTLELYNLLPDDVIVNDILFNDKSFRNNQITVPSYLSNPEPTVINTPYLGVQDGMFTVNTQYQGFNRAIKNDITLVSDGIDNPLLLNTAGEFDFINKLDGSTYEIKQGNWTVNKPIIVNGDLHISPSSNLTFSKDAYIIVKGSLTAIGGIASPITLKATSGSDYWKGIYVLNSSKKSHLKNINISNISALEDGLLKLTGGITFYKSDVDFDNVRINDIKAEDALNIVESKFTLNSVYINNTVSDGLDSDFSKGNVSNSEFSNIGGDALDFSGSNVSIGTTEANNIKDKAVSAGEKSTITIKNSTFNNIGVGIASKDGSSVTASNTTILNYALYGAMTYLKKDFYDMPSLTINNSSVSNGRAYIRQKGTSMTVDGVNIPETKISIKKLYKTKVMAK